MIGTRILKIIRDIRARKARTALIATSIFIGVFGTVTLFSMGDLLVGQLQKDLKQDQLAMLRAYVALPPDVEADNTQALDALRALPGVTAVEGQAVYTTYWKANAQDDFQSSFIFGYTEPLADIQLEPMRLTEGAFPQPGRQEVAVERRFAEKHDLKVGDTLIFRVLSGVQAAGEPIPEETWTISGIAFFPYGYGGFNAVLPEDSIFATYDDAQHIAGFAGLSSIYARYDDFATAEAEKDTFNATIASASPYIPVFTLVEDPAKNSLITFAETSSNVMGSLALIALVVSGFLVFNVLMTIVAEQKAQIGVMKSLGATRLDTFVIYSGMAFAYGIIGVIPGVLLGIPAGYFAAQQLAASSNTQIEAFGVSTRAIIIGVIVGLAVPVLASIIPVFNSTRVRIIDAITDLGISARYGEGPLARLVARAPLPINIRQGLSNVIRKKWRMAFTVLTLVVAAGAFMGIYAVFTSVNTVLNDFFDTFHFSFDVLPTDSDNLDAVQTLIQAEREDLTWRGPFSSIAIEIDGFDKEFNPQTGPPALFANGYDPATGAYGLTMESGDMLDDDSNSVILARSIADYIDKQVGDTITIHAGGHSGEYRIAGIAAYPFDLVWFDWRVLSRLAGYVDAEGNPVPTGILYAMNGDPTADEVDDVTEQLNDLLLAHGYTATYENIELFKESISEGVATFQLIFNFAALLIAVVGGVGLLSTLSMSVYERQKEIGVMRSIGAGSSSIVSQFLTEGVFVGLLAWLIGLPLSYLLSVGLIAALNLGDEYGLTYPPVAIVVGLVGMIVITTLASLWPSISAARRTVSDILRYQ
jgi:putative ABC transport system permease protein